MSFEEEADFLEHLRAEAARGEIVGAFWLRERLEKKLGHKVSRITCMIFCIAMIGGKSRLAKAPQC